jgi:hypothetical protein
MKGKLMLLGHGFHPSAFRLPPYFLCRAGLCWSSMKQSENLIGAFPHGSSLKKR